MTRTKLDTPAFADQSVDSRNIADGTIQNQDISGSLTNDKLANSSFTINGSSLSLGGSTSIIPFLEWQAVTVADGSTTLTAEAGKGYFLDTNTGVIEVFLPTSPSRGDTIALVDYSGTFATNKLIINTGGKLIDSTQGPDFKVETNNSIVELVYIDANKGWQVILNQAAGTTPTVTGNELAGGYDTPTYIQATGGTVTTSGDFKIHTFTGDGCFVVCSVGNPAGSTSVDYLVVAGGGGGNSGGGGAGGFRVSNSLGLPAPTTSPLASSCGLTVTATTFPITVGSGGSGVPGNSAGSNSIFSTITSAGGGVGAGTSGGNGGSGGGGGGACGGPHAGGSGNTPPVSPSQGNNGGIGGGQLCSGGSQRRTSAGGGGAGAVGTNATTSPPNITVNGPGGVGSYVSPSFAVSCAGTTGPVGSTRYFSGGGGGGTNEANGTTINATGGAGGGGVGGICSGPAGGEIAAVAGTANTGGGGGGGGGGPAPRQGKAGGKGIVIIRYKFQ